MKSTVKYDVNRMSAVLRTPYPEVPLPRAPLALVLCQIRFPDTPVLVDSTVLSRIREGLREWYPVMRREESASVAVSMTSGRSPEVSASTALTRFEQIDKSWFVTLNNEFLALSTTSYTARKDFIARLRDVVSVVATHADVPVCDRIGVRYVDRVTERAVLDELPAFVNPALLGMLGMDAREDVAVVHTLSDSVLALGGNNRLRTRCGVVPPGTALDPSVDAVNQVSWILDIDAFSTNTIRFSGEIVERAEALAASAYQVFRWAVTDNFLRFFGGQP